MSAGLQKTDRLNISACHWSSGSLHKGNSLSKLHGEIQRINHTCRPVVLFVSCAVAELQCSAQGDGTIGWDFSTTRGCTKLQLPTIPGPSKYKVKHYVSPMQHATAVANMTRTAKQQTALQMREWTQKYGKEGAAAMQQMQKLTPVKPSTGHQVFCHHTSLKCNTNFVMK